MDFADAEEGLLREVGLGLGDRKPLEGSERPRVFGLCVEDAHKVERSVDEAIVGVVADEAFVGRYGLVELLLGRCRLVGNKAALEALHVGLIDFVLLLVVVLCLLVVEFTEAKEDIGRVGCVGRILCNESGEVADGEFPPSPLLYATGVDAVVVEGNDAIALALVLVLGQFEHALIVVLHLFGVGAERPFETGELLRNGWWQRCIDGEGTGEVFAGLRSRRSSSAGAFCGGIGSMCSSRPGEQGGEGEAEESREVVTKMGHGGGAHCPFRISSKSASMMLRASCRLRTSSPISLVSSSFCCQATSRTPMLARIMMPLRRSRTRPKEA